MKFTALVTIAAGVGLAAAVPADVPGEAAADAAPEFFLIRHAEKNSDGTISTKGMKRAECLINVFGRDSKYNIQHIMVQTPHSGSQCLHLYELLSLCSLY